MKRASLAASLVSSLAAGTLVASAQTPRGEVPTLPLDEARDASGEGLAFLEVDAERTTFFPGERVPVRVRFGFEARFARENLVQLFRRELDLPVQLQAPWLEPGLSPRPGNAARTFALGSEVGRAARLGDELRDGRTFDVLEVRCELTAEAPGRRTLAAPRLRFAYATHFREDPFRGRVADERIDAYVVGNELVLEVREPPAEGRPPGFDGAVGRFTVEARAAPVVLSPGEGLELTLHVHGEGNAGDLAAPVLERLDGMEAFAVRGLLESPVPGGRLFVYDLAPTRAGTSTIPPVPLTFLDPGPPASYRTVATEPIEVVVRPRPEPPAAPPVEQPAEAPGARLLGLALTALVVLALVLVRRRRAGPDPGTADAARIAAAARRCRARLDAAPDDDDVATSFTDFLAECLERPAAAVVGPDLAGRLAAAGLPAPLAVRAATLLDELLAPRYGGPAAPDGARRARDLAAAAERAAGPGPDQRRL